MPPVAYLGKNSEPLVSLASCHLYCSFGFALTAPSATCRTHCAVSQPFFWNIDRASFLSKLSSACLVKPAWSGSDQCSLHWVYWNSGWTALRISPAEQSVMSLSLLLGEQVTPGPALKGTGRQEDGCEIPYEHDRAVAHMNSLKLWLPAQVQVSQPPHWCRGTLEAPLTAYGATGNWRLLVYPVVKQIPLGGPTSIRAALRILSGP